MDDSTTTNGGYSLAELLEDKTVPILKKMAEAIGFKFRGSPRKKDYVHHLCKIMLEQTEILVQCMFGYELKACMDVIEGKMTPEYANKSGLLFELNRFGIIYATIERRTKKERLHIESEMAERLRPLIPAELERREKDGSMLIEKLALGCANIYGYSGPYYFEPYLAELSQRLGRDMDNEYLTKALYPVLGLLDKSERSYSYGLFMSLFAPQAHFTYDNKHIDFAVEAKRFDLDTIIRYGEMPYPDFPLDGATQVMSMLNKYGIPGGERPEEVMRHLWIEKQDESKACGIPDFNKYFIFHDISQLNECMFAIVDFVNNLPYWRLRGNSSTEIMRKQTAAMKPGQMPKITIGPNMRSMGIQSFEQLQQMAARGEDLPWPPEGFPKGKVGRNDPCPCGSGKKYKNCCGK